MREIKFRAWNKNKKIMVYEDEDNSAVDLDGWIASDVQVLNQTLHSEWELEKYEFMQYTGLHDKNGKEIYEGDIVKLDNDVASMFNIKSTGKVEYNNGLFLVQNGDEIGILFSLFVLADTKYCLRGEVIGNIYDNPELLEGKEE